jgi:hypothetical protein
MQPNWFVDIEVRGAGNQLAAHSIALPVMARLMYILHGIFKQEDRNQYQDKEKNHEPPPETQNPYAIALPKMKEGGDYAPYPGHVVRVFADNEKRLIDLVKNLSENERLLSYITFSKARYLEEKYLTGRFFEYRRFRVPNKKSALTEVRERRWQEAKRWPYLYFKSKSQKTIFSLHIEQVTVDNALLTKQENDPNQSTKATYFPDYYGLSTKARPVYLPEVSLVGLKEVKNLENCQL